MLVGNLGKLCGMTGGIVEFFKKRLKNEAPLHRVDRQAAKYWVKKRLVHIFPELRDDPEALEKAYRELTLEPRFGAGEGGETIFEAILPGKL